MQKKFKKISLIIVIAVCSILLAVFILPRIIQQNQGITMTAVYVNRNLNSMATNGDIVTISSTTELNYLAIYTNEGLPTAGITFNLENDLDLTSITYTPIGTNTYPFAGTFDGNNYKVNGIYVNNSNVYQGLFGYVSNAIIENVGVDGINGGTGWAVGGVIGYALNSIVNNCFNSGLVTSYTNAVQFVGGVIAMCLSSTVINCYNTGTITGTYYHGVHVGGVVGYAYNSVVANCYNTGLVNSTENNGYTSVGGVVGYNSYSTISNCYNTGIVPYYTIYGRAISGAIVGTDWHSVEICNCYFFIGTGGADYGAAFNSAQVIPLTTIGSTTTTDLLTALNAWGSANKTIPTIYKSWQIVIGVNGGYPIFA